MNYEAELNAMSDDELVTELERAVAAVARAKWYENKVLVVAAARDSIKNPRLVEALGVRERQFYNRLRDARFRLTRDPHPRESAYPTGG